MADGGEIRSFMPGDEIELEIQVFTRARVKDVLAVFVQPWESSGSGRGPKLVFHGDVYSFSRTSEGRLSSATLSLDEDHSDPRHNGDYRLTALEVGTYHGKRLPSDHMPNLTIRIEQEPTEEQTTRITALYFTDE